MPPKPTRTINRLHFADLDPLRFEDLCLSLVMRSDKWKSLKHFGRTGSDGGIDIEAIKEINGHEHKTIVQGKRYKSIGKRDLDDIVSTLKKSAQIPDRLLLVVSCDFSKSNSDYLNLISREAGIAEVSVWSASVIEAMLYKDYKDLLFVYFGISVESQQRDTAASIRYSIRMEKRVLKDFIRHEYLKDNANIRRALYDTTLRFISDRVIIHSIKDTSYPSATENSDNSVGTWFRTHLYNFYHDGLELWLRAAMGDSIIMDENLNWELLSDYHDPRKNDSKYRVLRVKMIGQIPFKNIVDYKIDGDQYYSDPHIYCRFDYDGWPYERIYYKTEGDPVNERPDWELPNAKRTTFTK